MSIPSSSDTDFYVNSNGREVLLLTMTENEVIGKLLGGHTQIRAAWLWKKTITIILVNIENTIIQTIIFLVWKHELISAILTKKTL